MVLPNLCTQRYDGAGQSARLDQFPPADVAHLRSMYAAIQRLYQVLLPLAKSRQCTAADVDSIRNRPEPQQILADSRLLGGGESLPVSLRSILHDIRGGSLVALLVTIQLLDPARSGPDDVLHLFFYARDHLKMMRNGIPELDPVQTELDRNERPHAIGLLKEKWQDAQFAYGNSVSQVTLDCAFDGNISNRCMEFSALDRVIYNLMNNAARYAVDHSIGMSIFLPGDQTNVRFVLQNEITAEQAGRISELTGGVPSRLLAGGLTTGGHGLGLSICANFVSHAYGLPSPSAALAGNIWGSKLSAPNLWSGFTGRALRRFGLAPGPNPPASAMPIHAYPRRHKKGRLVGAGLQMKREEA